MCTIVLNNLLLVSSMMNICTTIFFSYAMVMIVSGVVALTGASFALRYPFTSVNISSTGVKSGL